MSDPVLYARDAFIGWVTLNRPEALNAMNDALLAGLSRALDQARDDGAVRVVILRGAGRVFCAGGDVNEMPSKRTETEYRAMRLPIERAIARSVRGLGKPLIAQIHGAAIGGGCVLATLCDLRVAAHGTRFALPEVKLGTTASLGGMYMLARVVGLGRAFELLYLGEGFDADRALAIGLVNRVVSPEALERETRAMAGAIADNFPRELALTREALLRGLDVDFLTAADFEIDAAMLAHLGGDVEAGFARARERMHAKRLGDDS